ncbi:MAG: pseudouridine synthase [Bacilli bacterium]|nr:pseudouridine synthase [Bacilli bacterium]
MERLQKIIAESGYCSRRKAEELIKNNKVTVNGDIVNILGTKANVGDNIIVEGKTISKEDKEYYLFYKPRGVISSTSDDKDRKTIMNYFNTNKRLYPVGRLDYNTDGAIIVTNDGEFANMLMHPKNELEKVYIVKVKGIIDGDAIRKLKQGIVINRIKCIPDKVKLRKVDKIKKSSIVEIVIHDGKNHEVKLMFERIGFLVDKLKRERIEFLNLDGLNSGEYRRITPKEIKKIYSLIK